MAHSTLVTVPSTQLAGDLRRADELAAFLIHGCLFQSETLLTDAHIINNPALRVAMQKYPELSEVLRAGGVRVHLRDSHSSLIHLYDDLKLAGAYHSGHDKAAFDDTKPLERFDSIDVSRYDSQLVMGHFSNEIVGKLATRSARALFAAALGKNEDDVEVGGALMAVVTALTEVRADNNGVLRERDFHQTVRPILPLREKLETRYPGLFERLESAIKLIEGAVYNTSIPMVTSNSIAFSSEHKTAARFLGRPTAMFNSSDHSRVLEIGSEYLNDRNLLRLTSKDMEKLRSSEGPYQRWKAAIASFKEQEEPTQGDRDQLKKELGQYISGLDRFIETNLTKDQKRSVGQKTHIKLAKVSRSTATSLLKNAGHLTDFVISTFENLGALSSDWKLAVSTSSEEIRLAATVTAAHVGTLIQTITKDEVLEGLRRGTPIRSGIYYDLPNETAYFS